MGYGNFKEIIGWIRRWRSVPVLAWTRAAANFSRGAFEAAAREYQAGLSRFPDHKVAPYARLDLSVCLERLGAYDGACANLMLLSNHPGPLQQLARIQLCFVLLLSDRGTESARIAALLSLDARNARSRANIDLLAVKALAAFETPTAGGRVKGRGSRRYGRPRAGGIGEGCAAKRSELSFERLPADNQVPTPAAISRARIEDLKPYRTISDLVDAVVQLSEGESSVSDVIALAEAKQSDGLWLWIIAGQKLLDRKEPLRARRLLNRALAIEPRAPRILSLIARTYLVSGEGYSPTFAVQLATKACQHSGWQSARAQAVLAECFYHSGDKLAALTVVQGSRSKLSDPQIQLLLESLSEQIQS